MIAVDSTVDPSGALTAAATALEGGGVVAIPTDTVYGLAVRAGDSAGIARLFEIKRRPAERNVAVLVSSKRQALELADDPPPPLERLMDRLWPGAVTLILPSGDGTIGVRCPDHPWVRELIEQTGPLATTSANLHGQPPLVSASAIAEHFGTDLAVVVDGGACSGQASTVVALSDGVPEILREGAVDGATVVAASGGEPPSS